MSDEANGLKVTISGGEGPFKDPDDVVLKATYKNIGSKPFSLTFWWTVILIVRKLDGSIVRPGPGPELPCGVPEEPTILEPGESHTMDRYLQNTQPGGFKEKIGWGYDLPPGTYDIKLIMNSPPKHGYDVSTRDDTWRGRVKSNIVRITIE